MPDLLHFRSAADAGDIHALVNLAASLKADPWQAETLGRRKTLGLLFFNPSLRTRLSTQIAAKRLGLDVIVMNVGTEGWAMEMTDGTVMNGTTVEHIREAAGVLASYCDILALRSFPSLTDRTADYTETVLERFVTLTGRPIVSLESATRHPLQSLADLLTIQEHATRPNPKIVLAWAPHVKALPQAVGNSFAEWTLAAGYHLTIAQPKSFELSEDFTKGARLAYSLEEALEDADFVYVKNWSSYHDYGRIHPPAPEWMLTPDHLRHTHNARVMHCLPVRRDLELSAAILDSPASLVQPQAANRVPAAQAVLHRILTSLAV